MCLVMPSHFYALWEEENSTEPPGWYLAKVLSVDDQGQARLQYKKGGHTEDINLSGIRWVPAKGNGKWFLPHSCDFPSLKPPPMVYSKPHKVKGYADDLTIVSSSPADHQEVITMVDDRCKDICLHVRPDKCYSLIYDGRATKNNPIISVGGCITTNIKKKPTTFLGSIIAGSSGSRKKASNAKFSEDFTSCLERLDSSLIRGEYKVWIYRRYLIPSLHYELSVNGTSVSVTRKLNSLATRYIKKWLGLSRSTTVAVIHHPSVLNIPALESCSIPAKISYLATVTLS